MSQKPLDSSHSFLARWKLLSSYWPLGRNWKVELDNLTVCRKCKCNVLADTARKAQTDICNFLPVILPLFKSHLLTEAAELEAPIHLPTKQARGAHNRNIDTGSVESGLSSSFLSVSWSCPHVGDRLRSAISEYGPTPIIHVSPSVSRFLAFGPSRFLLISTLWLAPSLLASC